MRVTSILPKFYFQSYTLQFSYIVYDQLWLPDMTYNVFGGTLSLTQSINHFTASVFKQLGHNMPAVLVRDLFLRKIRRFFSSAGGDYRQLLFPLPTAKLATWLPAGLPPRR